MLLQIYNDLGKGLKIKHLILVVKKKAQSCSCLVC